MTASTEPARWHEAPLSLPLREPQPAPQPVSDCPECLRLDVLRGTATDGEFVHHAPNSKIRTRPLMVSVEDRIAAAGFEVDKSLWGTAADCNQPACCSDGGCC
ncbi:hypothetical protein [Streptomyces sp. NBC_00091]|uniref:hypothetical protein n=1 Tax=Streptomyces sp. NBC_00091 TaxID=2975648 RepID=UPI002256842D|nr:hypothetical protein [Streptomyces sp. NBC_00091]MCX5377791.1 hypothetical protein [Streptomyces sp. NBC_00091]